ncbi:acyl-CoA dehydrogenase family protein [Ktedonobacter racemifer]|uniref:Acyl-CoA dehydrogenase type 2 domain protein n=1 Tax=Ktedonobacter racemifer DSM 44963 TaxID=485913 RepID=D6U2Q3_KTERA|nr:acyl-CoA dehydrogenase family protein [Ktedonobacter racemifer]EFH81017.1 Acyl-CoA dehydrogenase type 2 domain protein [Ktedonobacter racemifer DSM 44963]
MQATHIPTRSELVRRASEIIPVLQEHAHWNEEHRRIHDESIEALRQAGLFRLRMPQRYGGYESDTRTLVEVLAELGQGDGSTAWVAWVLAGNTWLVGMFPDAVQNEVFATPDVRVSGTLSPTGKAEYQDGGFTISGKWHFHSGSLHSQWSLMAAMSTTPEGTPTPLVALIPTKELEVVDDWNTAGLKGTGSVSSVARKVFVPAERMLPALSILQGQSASKQNAGVPIYRSPMVPAIAAAASGVPLGLAKAAMANFFQRLPERGIAYTNYARQAEAPITHLQVAEATMKIDEADFHSSRAATLVDTKAESDDTWTLEERARVRMDTAMVARLAKEAIDILNTASGGSSIYSHVPMQRIERDIQAANLQGMMHPNTNLELYGRIRCGLEPNTVNI